MFKFKRGMFIVFNDKPQILSICVNSSENQKIATMTRMELTTSKTFYMNDPAMEREATEAEVLKIMDGRPMPEWVKPIRESYVKEVEKPVATPQIETVMTLTTFQNQCKHHYVEYVGFTRVYKYCKHCDKKEH